MANFLTRFATSSQTSYAEGAGLRYTDQYWGSLNNQSGPSVHNTGFIPNTPISPIQMNTLFSQTTLTSYILGEVLASGIVKSKDNTSLITTDIDSTTPTESQDGSSSVNEDIVTPFINFLNRINDISGNGSTGSETVWRSRQIAYNDTTGGYWYVTSTGIFRPIGTGQTLQVKRIYDINSSDVGININSGSAPEVGININSGSSTPTITIAAGQVQANNFYAYTRYNTSGNTPSSGGSLQLLTTILNNIGTRLDDLGFSEGSITFAGESGIGSIKRQGNYVICTVNQTIQMSEQKFYDYMNFNETIIVLPNGYTPNESPSNIAIWAYVGPGQGVLFECSIEKNSNNITVYGYVNYGIDMNTFWNSSPIIRINFGYEARPRN